MLYTETKLFPYQMSQITKAWAKMMNYPLTVVTTVFVAFINEVCQD